MLTVLFGASPASAATVPPEKRLLRLCDGTVCYLAWRVVDSDGDGVCDADEIVAGTNPHDATSAPGLPVVAELLHGRGLPSFEQGYGAFLFLPGGVIADRATLGASTHGVFPPDNRKDTLTRLGVSADLIATFGISLERGDGFTLGATRKSGLQLGRWDGGRVSAGRATVHGGGVKDATRHSDGSTTTTYRDGSTATTFPFKNGHRTEHRDPDGELTGSRSQENLTRVVDGMRIDNDHEEVFDDRGNLVEETDSETHWVPGGANKYFVTTEYVRDEDGTVTGTIVTEGNTFYGNDGTVSTGQTTAECDAGGENCQNEHSTYEEERYLDPDQAYSTMVTQEAVDGVLRTRGAAINVVPGWTPTGDRDPSLPDPAVIMLVDDTTADLHILGEPDRLTTAQPETRPDLPSPTLPHDLPPTGGCGGLC